MMLGYTGSLYAAQQKEMSGMDRVEMAQQERAKWQGSGEDALNRTDPEFATITNNLVYGEILGTGSLGKTQKAMVILASLTATQAWDEMGEAVDAALRVGATALQIRETLYQCAPYVGVPRVKKALEIANGRFGAAKIALPLENAGTVTEASRFADGIATQKKIFGPETIDKMQQGAPKNQQPIITNYLSAWCFGDFYTRKVLDLKMRELITFCAIVSLGGCNPQAQAHAQANLSVGNSADDLLDAIAVMLPLIGYPRALNALGCVNAVLPKDK